MELGNSIVKTPEAESETPTRIQPAKQAPFTNGVLKRHAPLLHHRNRHPVVVTYKECLKNHAATIGGHAVDGCGEFMPSPNSNPAEPTTLKCAACGCHRNFHRREPDDPRPLPLSNSAPALEYQPHHRHQPPPPRAGSPNNSSSPPPISSSYAPHMLLALSHGISAPPPDGNAPPISPASTPAMTSGNRKRFRTKFTQNQKDKMLELAERVSWKMQKKDENAINEGCNEIGVERSVFKVWMHNNKTTAAKRDPPPPPSAANRNGINCREMGSGDQIGDGQEISHRAVATNGPSST
ncbi:zinc-finger homeodomain protein 9-like [Andrographis paniculata]|uniref:zinc-finger homeodomain protein 9-like n=1 Tax=Andrographis paniculata TaxID=175694 RepID=UPI0021E923AA|nr:zinc-finger homeodomain protein 9-like [Andrographis paniculata]